MVVIAPAIASTVGEGCSPRPANTQAPLAISAARAPQTTTTVTTAHACIRIAAARGTLAPTTMPANVSTRDATTMATVVRIVTPRSICVATTYVANPAIAYTTALTAAITGRGSTYPCGPNNGQGAGSATSSHVLLDPSPAERIR